MKKVILTQVSMPQKVESYYLSKKEEINELDEINHRDNKLF